MATWKPANAKEALAFDDTWCNQCFRDADYRETDGVSQGCPYLIVYWHGTFDKSEFPEVWEVSPVEKKPRCLKFRFVKEY